MNSETNETSPNANRSSTIRDVELPSLTPPSPAALIPAAIGGAVVGTAAGGLGLALLVLVTRPIVAIFLAILGSTTPRGEITQIGDVSVRFKTMGDFPFPDVELVCGAVGALGGLFAGAGIAYRKRYLADLLAPFAQKSSGERALAFVACVVSPKQFVRVRGVSELKNLGKEAQPAIPSLLALLSQPRHQENPAVAGALLAVDPENTTARESILHRLADVTPKTLAKAIATAQCLQSCGGNAAFAIPRLKEIAGQSNIPKEQKAVFEAAVATISKALEKEKPNQAPYVSPAAGDPSAHP